MNGGGYKGKRRNLEGQKRKIRITRVCIIFVEDIGFLLSGRGIQTGGQVGYLA